eukprot:COSAG02_NODE_4126_length_5741_cov_164.845090_1_plen_86_part_00
MVSTSLSLAHAILYRILVLDLVRYVVVLKLYLYIAIGRATATAAVHVGYLAVQGLRGVTAHLGVHQEVLSLVPLGGYAVARILTS